VISSRARLVVTLLAAAFAAKLIVLLELRSHPLLGADGGLDTTVYLQLASQVLAGNRALGPGLYFVSPLYIYFLAGVLSVVNDLTAVRLIQILLGTAAVACVFVAAHEWFGRRAAVFAAILASLTGLFTFHEVLLLQAALDPFLTAAALAALAIAFRPRSPVSARSFRHASDSRNRTRREGRAVSQARVRTAGDLWFGASGLLFGIQTLNRPNVLVPAVVVVALLAIARRWRPATAMAAGVLIALAPVAIRNIVVSGDWTPASSHGGLNFYIGNNADADGAYHPVPGITPTIAGQREDARRIAQEATGRALSDADVSAYFYQLGWSWIRLHPSQAAALFAKKLWLTLAADFVPLNDSYPFYRWDAHTFLRWLFVGPWLLIPLGAIGLLLAFPASVEDREANALTTRRLSYSIWLSFIPAYSFSVAIFFAAERYRLPLLVPFCIGAGAALDEAIARRHGFRAHVEGVILIAVLALTALVNWPTHRDDGRTEERVRMAEAMIRRGQPDEAERWLAKAEEGSGSHGLMEFRVGRAFLATHTPEAAVRHFERALQIDRGQPEVEYALGQALVDASRPREAIPHLRAGMRGGVRVDLAGFDLARALGATGDRTGALQQLQTLRPSNPDEGESWQALGQLAMQLRAPSLAASFFNEAIRARPNASKPRQDMGLALTMLGRYPEALANFEQAVVLDPSDAAAQLNLAVAYGESGRTEDARFHAQEALRLRPGYERAEQFLRALK
jgi:tetratricopeptide (TPR) repeat protein